MFGMGLKVMRIHKTFHKNLYPFIGRDSTFLNKCTDNVQCLSCIHHVESGTSDVPGTRTQKTLYCSNFPLTSVSIAKVHFQVSQNFLNIPPNSIRTEAVVCRGHCTERAPTHKAA